MGMQKVCGKCGKELKCIKTGASVRYEGTPSDLVYQCDVHACKCGTVMLYMNDGGYFREETARNPDVLVNPAGAFFSDDLFAMWSEYYQDWSEVIHKIFKRRVSGG